MSDCCPNCEGRYPGAVLLVDEENLCMLCQRDCSDSPTEQYWREKIGAQAEVLANLLAAHDALGGHTAQSILATNILDAAKQLSAAHDAHAESRMARGKQ